MGALTALAQRQAHPAASRMMYEGGGLFVWLARSGMIVAEDALAPLQAIFK